MSESLDHATALAPASLEASDREAERAARLLAEEIRRRKRVLWYYLTALLIPIGLGAYALATGRRDTAEHLADDTRIDSVARMVREVQPAIARLENIDTTLRAVSTTRAELQRQRTTVVELQSRQAALEDRLSQTVVPASLALVDSVRNELRANAQRLQTVSTRIDEQTSVITSQRAQINRQTDEIQVLRRGQDSIRAEVRRIPPTRNQIDPGLLERIKRLELRTDSLRARPSTERPRPVVRPNP